jgi:hypothetical protein
VSFPLYVIGSYINGSSIERILSAKLYIYREREREKVPALIISTNVSLEGVTTPPSSPEATS